jgi:hypothetical protein
LNQREGEMGNRGEYRSQSWAKNTNMTESTVRKKTLINACRKIPLQVNFFMTKFCIDFYEASLPTDKTQSLTPNIGQLITQSDILIILVSC